MRVVSHCRAGPVCRAAEDEMREKLAGVEEQLVRTTGLRDT